MERWEEIIGAKGYFISDHGNVKGRRGNILSLPTNAKGYFILAMPIAELGKTFTKSVHRLVATHFLEGDCSLQVNHIDGNKKNNHYSNLEYLSCKDNINHAIKLGLRTARSNLRNNSMFDLTQIKVIKHAIKDGYGNREIAGYFKCDHSTISKIRVGTHYPNVTI